MKVLKRVLCLALVCLMLMTMLAGCKRKLVGEWQVEEGNVTVTVLKLEKDGTGEFMGVDIEWKKKGKFLVIKANGEEEQLEYKIKGDTMTLANPDGGDELVLTKKK